jgi:hypothetical protein
VDEIEVLIKDSENALERQYRQRDKLKSPETNMSKADKKKALQVIDEQIKGTIIRFNMLTNLKEFKIPFYEKLPKQSQFYLHYMQVLFND